MKELRNKATAAIMAGLLAVSAVAPATVALAIDPTAGEQTGTGATDVTVQSLVGDQEMGGTEDPNNPPQDSSDPTSPGSNIAFTVPSSINYVVDAEGNLTGPSTDVCYMQNLSSFAIHASSERVVPQNGWTIEDVDAQSHETDNAANFQFGPSAGLLDAYDYLGTGNDYSGKVAIGDAYRLTTDTTPDSSKTYYTKNGASWQSASGLTSFTAGTKYYEKTDGKENAKAPAWNLAANDGSGASDDGDARLPWSTSGHLYNVTQDLTEAQKIATIHTYVTAGSVAQS